jgi:hypothetical protein
MWNFFIISSVVRNSSSTLISFVITNNLHLFYTNLKIFKTRYLHVGLRGI